MDSERICRSCSGKGCGAKALFRYQGGKQKLCGLIVGLFPRDIKRYFEPFLGAGSVCLELRNRGFRGPSFLGDWNLEVANVHQAVAAAPGGFEAAYRAHVERHCREYFYHLRGQGTLGWTTIERAARTVYLAKAAFHGLLRVNAQGRIASTYGTGELGRVKLDGGRIRAVSAALQGADIRHGDFGWVETMAAPGDLVFMDPPYVDGNDAYTAEGFGEQDHLRLHRICRALDAKGVRFLQTNSDRSFVRDLYRGYRMFSVAPAPAIGRGGAGRQPVGEVIIANFEPNAAAPEGFAAAA
jgi:DNA adenine methylase